MLNLITASKDISKLKRRIKSLELHVDFKFVTQAQMIALNFKYRKIRKDTDVLSFPATLEFQKFGFLGAIVMSTKKVKSQSKQWKHPIRDEVALLMAHGLLHLLGFDHEKNAQEKQVMRSLEVALLKKIGVELPGLIDRYK